MAAEQLTLDLQMPRPRKMKGRVTWLDRAPRSPRPHWLVSCQPHVMTKLKQTFPKVNKGEFGSVLLLDNPETSRDLLWFLQRWPMTLEPEDLQRLRSRSRQHEEQEEFTERVLSGEYQPSETLVTEMAIPARPYPQIAADLACSSGRLLLADDLGLGKTISGIATIARAGKFPAVVVTLTHLPLQWEREINRFCPSLRTHIVERGQPYDLSAPKLKGRKAVFKDGAPQVLIINYHKLVGWADDLAAMGVEVVVFDEVHELRVAGSNKYNAATRLSHSASVRLGLSATPIWNYGGEIYNVINALADGELGSPEEFYREWCNYGSSRKSKLEEPDTFGEYVRESGLMLRRTRSEVGRELPALSTFPIEVDTEDMRVSDHMADLALTILSSEEAERGAKFRAASELDYLLRHQTGMAKSEFVAEFVKGLVQSGESVVLYGWHHDVYKVWRQAFADHDPAFFTGKETPAQKEREIERFKSGKTKIAVLSLRAGAGLDGLQSVCRSVVFGEIDWSPGVHEQAIGRVYRDGQLHPVFAYFLLATSGSDPIIADVLGVKRGQIDGIRDPNAPLVEAGADPGHIRKLAEEFLRQRGRLPDLQLEKEAV